MAPKKTTRKSKGLRKGKKLEATKPLKMGSKTPVILAHKVE
jgi:hypothetical protein